MAHIMLPRQVMTASKLGFLSFCFLGLVACGGRVAGSDVLDPAPATGELRPPTSSSGGSTGPVGTTTPDVPDTRPPSTPPSPPSKRSTQPPEAPVTDFFGTFHALDESDGNEFNLEIFTDGTWKASQWTSGGEGDGGGACAYGSWTEAQNSVSVVLFPSDGETFPWQPAGSVQSVTLSIEKSVLVARATSGWEGTPHETHFGSGFRCFDWSSHAYAACTQMKMGC